MLRRVSMNFSTEESVAHGPCPGTQPRKQRRSEDHGRYHPCPFHWRIYRIIQRAVLGDVCLCACPRLGDRHWRVELAAQAGTGVLQDSPGGWVCYTGDICPRHNHRLSHRRTRQCDAGDQHRHHGRRDSRTRQQSALGHCKRHHHSMDLDHPCHSLCCGGRVLAGNSVCFLAITFIATDFELPSPLNIFPFI